METDESAVDTSSLKIVTSDTDVSKWIHWFWSKSRVTMLWLKSSFVCVLQLKTDYWFESGEEVTLTDLWNNFCWELSYWKLQVPVSGGGYVTFSYVVWARILIVLRVFSFSLFKIKYEIFLMSRYILVWTIMC